MQAFAALQETDCSSACGPVRAPGTLGSTPVGCGTFCICQLCPSQRSTKASESVHGENTNEAHPTVLEKLLEPTATQAREEPQDTPCRSALCIKGGTGIACRIQRCPFQRSASGNAEEFPRAMHDAPRHEIAPTGSREFRLQRPATSCSTNHEFLTFPTAMHLSVDTHDTPFNVEPRSGCSTATRHAGAAALATPTPRSPSTRTPSSAQRPDKPRPLARPKLTPIPLPRIGPGPPPREDGPDPPGTLSSRRTRCRSRRPSAHRSR